MLFHNLTGCLLPSPVRPVALRTRLPLALEPEVSTAGPCAHWLAKRSAAASFLAHGGKILCP